MSESETFQTNPRDFALELVENGMDKDEMILCCLKYMSHDDVRDMLDCNELSPRFLHCEKLHNFQMRFPANFAHHARRK